MEKIKNEFHQKNNKKNNCKYRFILFIPALIYLPGIFGWIAYPAGEGTYSDLLLTHYPYALFLKNSIIQGIVIPLWSNLIYSGFPFAANPLSGFWYLPGWMALLFPLPEGINITLALHSVFGAWGFYRFLRAEKVSIEGAIFGGLAFGLLPKLGIHYGAGHVTLLYSIAWSPWLFLVSKSDKMGWKTGIVAGLLFLADPRWAVLVGILWLAYDIAHREPTLFRGLYYYFQSAFVAFLIASPLILPLAEYVKLSTRSTLSSNERLIFSLPPEKLLGVIVPVSGGNIEWFTYIGGVLFGLIVFLFATKKLWKANSFWIAGAGISTFIALGSYLPGFSYITELPLISLLRVPARTFFISSFCLVIIASKVFEHIIEGDLSPKRVNTIMFSLLVFSILFGTGMFLSIDKYFLQAIWGFIALGISSLAYLLFAKHKRKRKYLPWILMTILTIDLLGAIFFNNRFELKDEVLSQQQDLLGFFRNDGDKFRVYSPSFSVPQYLSVAQGLELVDGVEPLQLKNYVDFMINATGVKTSEYTVTIPSYETGNPVIDNVDKVPDPYLLGLLNVKYVASEYPIVLDGLNPIGKYSSTHLYENIKTMPRAWISTSETRYYEETDRKYITEAVITDWSPNFIAIKAEGPGTLILSEINYPGWTVYVDGNKENIQPAYEILRSVEISDGEHEIIFKYKPWTIYLGVFLAALGWIYSIWKFSRKK